MAHTTDKRPRSDGELGVRIRRRRKAMGLTAKELARIAEVSASYVSQLEHGKQDHPSLEVLGSLARALGSSVSELLGDEATPAANAGGPVSPVLAAQAEELGLDAETTRMLAGIGIAGRRPATRESWLLIYLAIRHACGGSDSGIVPTPIVPILVHGEPMAHKRKLVAAKTVADARP